MSSVFNILDNRIKELAVSRFEKPTFVQEIAIPKVLDGKNVLVIAETGSGKCVSGDSLVFMNCGLHRADSLLYGKVNSLNTKNLKTCIEDGFLTKKDTNPMLKVVTRHGYSIKCTYDHKFFTINGWKKAEELSSNDFVATVRKWNIEPEILPELELKSTNKMGPKKTLKIKFTENFAYFVGVFLGDGSYNNKCGIRITNKSEEIIEDIRKTCSELNLKLKQYETNEYRIDSNLLKQFLEQNGAPDIKIGCKGGKSRNVFISNLFLKSPENIIASLIGGLYDADGWISENTVSITSCSEQLIKSLQFALLRFGIISIRKIRYKKYKEEKRKYYELRISDRLSIKIFFKVIKLNSAHKKEKLQKIVELEKRINPNIDVIPLDKEIFRSLKKQYKIKWNTKIYQMFQEYLYSNKKPSNYSLEKIVIELSKQKNSEILNSVFKLLNNDVLWDKVVFIEKCENEIVYDFTVPKTKNFIAEGFVLHNTESVMLGLFNKLVVKEHAPIALLYITPLKALNRNLMDRLIWWCNKLDIEISIRHGDTTQYERKMQLEHPPQILISTPEQIGAMLVGKRFREHLKNLKYIVIDEIHEIVNSKRGVQLTVSLERLKRYCGEPQIIALSATVGSPETAAKFIFSDKSYEIVNAISPKNVQIRVESPYPNNEDKVMAEKIFIGNSVVARLRRIHDLILEHHSTLVFTNTREAAEILSSRLRMFDENLQHEIHHSSLSKEVRIKAEKDFKEEKLKSIICTSSLQLGIDIGSIDLVLQYQSPRTVTQFLQRSGRSGHGVGRVSKGIIIAGEGDDIFESVVIARKALKGEMEQLKIHRNSLDVLTQQIIGLTMEDYNIDPKMTFDLIRKAYPFKSLREEDFNSLVIFLTNQLRLIFSDNGIKRRRKALEYYFENLSMIPDQKSYKVLDTTSNSFVGTLDEEFIASHGDAGSSFIVKGRPWKILSVENDKVFVESVDDIESAIPAWGGELIPVPFDVAQEVGALRREIKKMLDEKMKNNEIIKRLESSYPISSQTAVKMVQILKNQIKKYPLADEKSILIEKFNEYVVLHSLFGSLVNETLSRFISAILSADYGEIITSKTDPYRIIIKGCSVDDVKKVLLNYKPEDIEVILEKSLPRSSLFKFRFIHVAKRFGAISKKASFESINIDRMIDAYWNSPIHKETMQELFIEKLDIEKTKEIIQKIQNKEIKVQSLEGLSPLAEMGFRYELHDVARPERPEKEIFNIFKNRILNSKVRLLCINCGKYSISETVKDIEDLRCRICQSKLIAILKPHREEAQNIVKKWLKGTELTDEEKEKLEFIKKSADLTIVYNKDAAIVLAGRGIGPQTATRVLSKPRRNEDDLFKHILEAEREWIKNKKYWQ